MKIIAYIENDFTEKFGIPRQSGLSPIVSRIVFKKEYRVKEAFRGLSGYSHLWLIWKFSKAERAEWSPTVRPPRLGGNTRMGVFATRSPFRPNPVGLSSVKLLKVDIDNHDGPVLYVEGADLMNKTPIYDIKPYLAYTDAHPDAIDGFALTRKDGILTVEFPEEYRIMSDERYNTIISVLSQDPRPQYQDEPERVYNMAFGGYDISFTVSGNTLKVCEVAEIVDKNR